MKKIILMLALLLIMFAGIGEAKIHNAVIGTSVSLNGITLTPGDSTPLFDISADYHYARVCINIPPDPGYVRVINTTTNTVITSGGTSCSFMMLPIAAGSLVLQNRPDNNVTTVTFGSESYFLIEIME